MLHDLDKELHYRGYSFVRYADDCNIITFMFKVVSNVGIIVFDYCTGIIAPLQQALPPLLLPTISIRANCIAIN